LCDVWLIEEVWMTEKASERSGVESKGIERKRKGKK